MTRKKYLSGVENWLISNIFDIFPYIATVIHKYLVKIIDY